MVGINVPIPVPMAYYSFGGWKASLFGDLHVYGPDGVRFYTRGKVVTAVGRSPPPRRGPRLPDPDDPSSAAPSPGLNHRDPAAAQVRSGLGATSATSRSTWSLDTRKPSNP